MEFGPYIYQETDTLDNLEWTQLVNPLNNLTYDAVKSIFN